MIPYVSQFALDLQFDGLMIESHLEPKAALSDAAQQLTPDELFVLMQNLELRKPTADSPIELSRLEDLRDQIDEIDTAEEERVADELRNFFLRTLDKHHGFHSFYSPDDDEP
jgi:chorismate mutase